jgi:hypothetical protein
MAGLKVEGKAVVVPSYQAGLRALSLGKQRVLHYYDYHIQTRPCQAVGLGCA